jgi:SAM-dependent methyltransferase
MTVDAAREIHDDAGRIRANKLLYEIYLDVYRRLLEEVPEEAFPRVLELGSGGGFLRRLAPRVITSECVSVAHVDRVVDACRIAEHFEAESLDAVVAFDVFHHLPNVTGFLHGVEIVLRVGGRVVMVEPWYTPVGQWFHRVLHHEPYLADPNDWRVVGEGRMAGANTRLPTSVLRDSDARFAREFTKLRIVKRQPFHKWLYLVSGGLKLNTRVPAMLSRALVSLDRRIRLGDDLTGLFALIVIERTH